MRGRIRAVAVGAAVAAMLSVATVAAGPARAQAPPVCHEHAAPPGPPAVEEGPTPVAPLPVQDPAVGGPALGTCDLALPAGAPPLPTGIDAAGWVVADLDSGAVLAARDAHGRQRPASTLKLLTTLVVLDRLPMDQVVSGDMSDVQVDGSRAGIGPGGTYTVQQLLSGLLLNSGNDTAHALARTLGGVPQTLDLMQQRAAALGALDTRPATPSGLDGPGMSTSAYDLALLFRAAMRNPTFAELTQTRLVQFPGFGTHAGFMLSNDDPLLRSYDGALGGKTGFTDAARHTFVGAARRDGRRIVVALVRGEQHPVRMVAQASTLLDYGFALPAGLAPVGTLVDQAPVTSAPATPGAPAPQGSLPESSSPVGWIVAGLVLLVGLSAAVGYVVRRVRAGADDSDGYLDGPARPRRPAGPHTPPSAAPPEPRADES
ncbi:D-alanyl-D-alanine carboxypeptidase family protein [Pseudonocardia sp. N23]|uniref:D-alanyl-D-alanine carboxypeptidase family protein n=1 Tax=Pseudonocardia sp. N23 TaxID=1987376 RepID=UPI00209C69D9|nr:serine hydrolase [Pseudonocardia sp. N23]